MAFDFNRYIEVFNTNNEDALAQFYADDIVVEGPDRTINGLAEWLGILKFAHHGVKEKLVPVMVVREGDNVMAEANAEFTASIDRPDFPFVALKAGQQQTVKYFASYRIRGDKIAHLTLGCWFPSMRSV